MGCKQLVVATCSPYLRFNSNLEFYLLDLVQLVIIIVRLRSIIIP